MLKVGDSLNGDRIKQLRQKKRMSISEVAEKAGVAKSYLSSIERNIQTNPSLQFIEKISQVLGVSAIDIIEGHEITDEVELDQDWVELMKEAISSGITKEQFKEYVEFHKWRQKE